MDRALTRIVAEIRDGIHHGFFTFSLDCEIIGAERRRLTFRAGKSYQFVIPLDECARATDRSPDSPVESDHDH